MTLLLTHNIVKNKMLKVLLIVPDKRAIVYKFNCLLVGCNFLITDQVRWAIGNGRLNTSPEGLIITPPFHQRHLLWPPSSLRKVVFSRERLPP